MTNNEIILLVIAILIVIFILSFIFILIHSFRKEKKADIEARRLRNELNAPRRYPSQPYAPREVESFRKEEKMSKSYARKSHKKVTPNTGESNLIETHYVN